MAKPTPQQEYVARRRVARKLSLMAIYQWHLNEEEFPGIYTYFQEDEELAKDLRKADPGYFKELTEFVMENSKVLDERITPFLDRPLEQVGPIEHSVLLLATTELQNHVEVPFKTVVNEWVNLAKKFGPEQSFKFANGVLDKLGRDIRPHENS